MIVIDCFVDKIWGKNSINKNEMKKIIKECLTKTNKKAKNVFLNVSFVNRETIKKYNSLYRNKDKETNVLSFENKEQQNYDNFINLGEMILCYEVIKDESIQFNKDFKERLYHLFVHSILHLLGYDHIIEKEREQMEKLEEEILQKFNIYNPYFID